MSTYENHKKAIDRLYEESLQSFVDLTQLHESIKEICDEFDSIWKAESIFQINPWTFSKPHIIFGVNERIRLSRLIQPNEESTFEEKYHIPPLAEYLLLTCIDQLGQPEGWLTFDSWLKAKKKKDERKAIVDKISNNDIEDIALTMFKGYQDNYGVKNSFFGFFNSLINAADKTSFLDKIKVEIIEGYPENFTPEYGDEMEKLKYLYSVRNNFTHRTKPTGPYILLWPDHKDKNGWFNKEEIHDKTAIKRIKVAPDYHEALENLVKVGIWEFIKLNGPSEKSSS